MSLKYLIQVTRGIIRDGSTRRMAMFVLVIIAMLMVFVGAVFLNSWLLATPVLFIAYWIVCGWLTFTAVLLAIYDLIAVRVRLNRERRGLKQEVFGDDEKDSRH
jgi:uncharacterized membrane protein (DUF485 family)